MKTKLGLTFLLSLFLCVVFCFAEPTNFTATMSMMGMENAYARDGKKIRSEIQMGEGMSKMVSIVRLDVKKNIMLSLEKKLYFEDVWKQNKRMHDPSLLASDTNYKVEKVKLGSETIDKHPCIKYTMTVTNKQTGEKHTGTIWEATDLQNLLIKYESADESGRKFAYQLKNVKLNAATPDMFEVPAGYKQANSMMELMGMGGMGMPGMRMQKSNKADSEE